jgi:hypothetical protein
MTVAGSRPHRARGPAAATIPGDRRAHIGTALTSSMDDERARTAGVLVFDASSAAPDPPPADARVRTRATSTA